MKLEPGSHSMDTPSDYIASRMRQSKIQKTILYDKRRVIAAVILFLYVCTSGCSSASPPQIRSNPDQVESLSKIQSIALVAPYVQVLRQGIAAGPSAYERAIPEWSEAARRNILQAATQQFGKLFVVRESETDETADAHLAVSASDEIKTGGRRGMDTLGLAYGAFLMPMLYVTVVPMLYAINPKGDIGEFNRNMLKVMWPAGLTTIKFELTRPASGEVVWSFVKESRRGYDLRDPASVESLVAEAVEDLSKTISRRWQTERPQ